MRAEGSTRVSAVPELTPAGPPSEEARVTISPLEQFVASVGVLCSLKTDEAVAEYRSLLEDRQKLLALQVENSVLKELAEELTQALTATASAELDVLRGQLLEGVATIDRLQATGASGDDLPEGVLEADDEEVEDAEDEDGSTDDTVEIQPGPTRTRRARRRRAGGAVISLDQAKNTQYQLQLLLARAEGEAAYAVMRALIATELGSEGGIVEARLNSLYAQTQGDLRGHFLRRLVVGKSRVKQDRLLQEVANAYIATGEETGCTVAKLRAVIKWRPGD